MEKKYLNESRYKKSTAKKRRNSKTVKANLKNVRQAEKLSVKEKKQVVKNAPTKVIKKKKKRKQKGENKLANILTCVIMLIVIAVISRAILKDEDEPFIYFPFMASSNAEVISIGIITNDSLLDKNTSNLVINELNKYSKDMLIEINEDYSITYRCISNIQKVSNSEYMLTKNPDSDVNIAKIKQELELHSKDELSVYYTKLKNIESIIVIDENKINIKLKEPDAYFIYNLDVCLTSSKDFTNYIQDEASSKNKLILNRHEDANKELPAKIVVTRYKDMYAAVEAYKQKEINIFVTDAENVQNILGKHEYNIKAYRNGKCVFLFGNPTSELYSRPEVRKAIAYSIDRDGIIQDILKSKGDKIDLPYIYDEVKYKYDVYAAENLLLTNKYTKSNKVYSKTENGKKTTLELDLIVNKNDDEKISIANKIKNNLSAIGIKVNVIKLASEKVEERIGKGNYDLCLATVNLNNNPNIAFVENNLYVTEHINLRKESIHLSNVEELNVNISSLQSSLSEELSAIGIYIDVSYVIYSKDVIGIDKISYMNLFKNILK